MPFCTQCGKQLADGEQCSCTAQQPQPNYQQSSAQQFKSETGKYVKYAAGEISGSVVGSVNSWKENIKSKSAYERGQQIIPDTIKANDSEIPIKQYDHVAKLRSRSKLTWAEGKMQLTNKRLIFRAPGRCLLSGKTVLQHEFAIDDISGIELRKDHRFSFLDLIFALVVGAFGMGIMTAIFMALYSELEAFAVILGLIAGAALMLPLFMLKEDRFYLKLLTFSGAIGAFMPLFGALTELEEIGVFFAVILYFVMFIAELILVLKIAFQKNLNITIKTQSGTGVIEIRRRQVPTGIFSWIFGGGQIVEYTGYDEVLPDKDTDRAVRELGAIINDIQKLGDFAVEKWR